MARILYRKVARKIGFKRITAAVDRTILGAASTLQQLTLLALGTFLGYQDLLIHGAENGHTSLYVPFWDFYETLHWHWDVTWGSIVGLLVFYVVVSQYRLKRGPAV
jgi:hypothetical protein